MKRNIQLSEGTQTLINAILDLEQISGQVYSLIRDEFSKDDKLDDPTGNDILDAAGKLRDVFQYYLRDRFNYEMTSLSNLNGTQAVI